MVLTVSKPSREAVDTLCTAGTQSHREQHEAGTALTVQMATSPHGSFSLLCSNVGPPQTGIPSETSAWSSFYSSDPGIDYFSLFFVPFPVFLPFLKFREASPAWLAQLWPAEANAGAVSP